MLYKAFFNKSWKSKEGVMQSGVLSKVQVNKQ